MKKITLLAAIMLPFLGFSQAEGKIQQYLNASAAGLGLSQSDINGWIVESKGNSTATQIDNYYIKQRVNGIEVFNAVTNVWVKNGEVLHAGNRFLANASQKANSATPSLSVLNAMQAALSQLGVNNPGAFEVLETEGHNVTISNGVLTDDPIRAELVYQPVGESLKLAWDLNFYTPDYRHLWSVRIDAASGEMLEKNDMVISCCSAATHNHKSTDAGFTRDFFKNASALEVQSGSYRVVPFNFESPNHSPRQLITSPHDAVASPFGWHDTNGIAGNDYTITRGNNVWAMDDVDGGNGTGVSPNGGAGLSFDFPYGGVSSQPSTYLDASITNLFYMSNIMHDVWFQYGFNEQNGNFQQKNYSGFAQPGFGGDAVNADAQDGSGATPQNINNANFSTPADGQKPRVQMFLWNVLPSIQPITIYAPADIAGPRDARDNSFSPGHVNIPIAPAIIEGQFVLYDDGSPDIGQTDNADACGAAVNAAALNGNIAVIRRSLAEASGGSPCAFIEKVKNAQNAGALAAIIVNNVDGIIGMSGADATITIPAVSVTNVVGEELIARIKIETVTGKIQLAEPPFINADGDFDNGIIAHEIGHGISNRLTGGALNANCLFNAEQAGEGWSDWFMLMMQLKSGDVGESARSLATFALSQPVNGFGLRGFPYSTDMNVNPLTFADTNDDVPHNRGEVMAATLWDLTWAYITKYGYDPNIYSGTGGNNKVMQRVIDGLKLQPCSPTFIEFRDALIAADQQATGGQDYCMIWKVFARRGMGVNASSGSRTSALDQVQNFSEPSPGPACTLSSDEFALEDLVRIYPNPANGVVNVRVNGFAGQLDIEIVDINGRVVMRRSESAFNVETSLNVSILQKGMYIIRLKGENLSYNQKVILN